MTDLVTIGEIQILAQQPDDSVLVDEVEVVEVIAVAEQGPPGPQGLQGIQGPIGDTAGALLVSARLAEFATDEAQATARANIGLAVIDGGTFF